SVGSILALARSGRIPCRHSCSASGRNPFMLDDSVLLPASFRSTSCARAIIGKNPLSRQFRLISFLGYGTRRIRRLSRLISGDHRPLGPLGGQNHPNKSDSSTYFAGMLRADGNKSTNPT